MHLVNVAENSFILLTITAKSGADLEWVNLDIFASPPTAFSDPVTHHRNEKLKYKNITVRDQAMTYTGC